MEETKLDVKKTYTDPVTGKFVKGNPGGGRPKGTTTFKTKWEKFVTKIAEKNELLPEDIDEQLLAVAYKKAKTGDFHFYKDIHDRVHGKAAQSIDLTTGGEKIGKQMDDEEFDILMKKYESNAEGKSKDG